MDSGEQTADLLAAASERLGRPIRGTHRGGASDASYLAGVIGVTIDGLGPLGGAAHTPREYVVAASLRTRAEVALALVDATLV
jgi:glutamate carboxypeptidase